MSNYKQKEKIYKISAATVKEDCSGIDLRIIDESQGLTMLFLPKEECGRIPKDRDEKKELELLSEVLIGQRINIEIENGEKNESIQ